MKSEIKTLVESTPIVDTHEHLVEEKIRLRLHEEGDPGPPPIGILWIEDIGLLFNYYFASDLLVAGMPREDLEKVHSADTPPDEKWSLVKPWWDATKNTGYGWNVRETIRALFGEDDIRDDNWQKINESIKSFIHPGFYDKVLREISNIDHCQVNSLVVLPFCETESPDLLLQDISLVQMCTQLNLSHLSELSGIGVSSLDDWYQVIDWVFETYGPRAIAVKNQSAYTRRLNFDMVDKSLASRIFARYISNEHVTASESLKPLEDHLFHYCVRKATEYNLPVKLHTGYYAGENYMPLHRVRDNPGDLCPLLQAHPDANFVIMHITYPYQDEAISIAKHYSNAYIDMCWAWIINPAAGVRFLKEYLMAAPSNKIFTFGGDYAGVEMVPGHVRVARKGIVQALTELLDENWIGNDDIPGLVERLLRRNAYDLFKVDEVRSRTAM